jgi:chromosome segregation ATPase
MSTATLEQEEPLQQQLDESASDDFSTTGDFAALPEVDDAFASLRNSSEAIAELVDEVFEDFELLGVELTLRSQLVEQLRAELQSRTESLRLLERAEVEVRAELAAAERELSSAQTQLTDLPQQIAQLREQLHAIELERCSLEVELEALRVRAAELTDQLVELKRESADERAEWSGELKQLRRSLERQAELFADRLTSHARSSQDTVPAVPTGNAPAAPPAASKELPPEVHAAASDAVLGSVISQFEALQKDRQRRRTK